MEGKRELIAIAANHSELARLVGRNEQRDAKAVEYRAEVERMLIANFAEPGFTGAVVGRRIGGWNGGVFIGILSTSEGGRGIRGMSHELSRI